MDTNKNKTEITKSMIREFKERYLVRDDGTVVYRYDIPKSKRKKGDFGGTVRLDGYTYIRVFGKKYALHRMLWAIYHGAVDATKEIDHIDGDTSNNRMSNLCQVDSVINFRNRRSPVGNVLQGVTWFKSTKKWGVRINNSGFRIYLGCFKSHWDAVCVRKSAENYYGYEEGQNLSTTLTRKPPSRKVSNLGKMRGTNETLRKR